MGEENCVSKIQRALATLEPYVFTIEDQSQFHAGHGASGGHFKLTIASKRFAGLPPIACHRLIYQCLGRLMEGEIHALQIEIV